MLDRLREGFPQLEWTSREEPAIEALHSYACTIYEGLLKTADGYHKVTVFEESTCFSHGYHVSAERFGQDLGIQMVDDPFEAVSVVLEELK